MKTNYVFLVLMMAFLACDDIVEIDISNKEVFLISPTDGAIVESTDITLWWDYVDGASAYNVIMASPSLSSPVHFIADTILEDNRLTLFVPDGAEYEWGVSALNGAYSSDFYFASFSVSDSLDNEIDSLASTDISNSTIRLLAPGDNQIADSGSVTFWWEELPGAFEYEFSIVTPNFYNIGFLIVDSTLTGNEISLNLDTGQYEWRVRGINNISSTDYESRSVAVVSNNNELNLSTAEVILMSPQDSALFDAGQVVFRWEEVDGASTYEIMILSPDFENPTELIVNDTQAELIYQVELDSGNYQWGVRAINSISRSPFSIRSLSVD